LASGGHCITSDSARNRLTHESSRFVVPASTTGSEEKGFDSPCGALDNWVKLAASRPGRMTSPMIQVDSHLLFGTAKRGLVGMKPKE
jgi:hypothetical protein